MHSNEVALFLYNHVLDICSLGVVVGFAGIMGFAFIKIVLPLDLYLRAEDIDPDISSGIVTSQSEKLRGIMARPLVISENREIDSDD